MGGRGSSSGIGARYNSVMNPQTKDDFVSKLKVIGAHGQPGYNLSVSTSDWEGYGKSRTYFKIDAYREGDRKLHHSMDYGYYDNRSKKYVASKKYNDLSGNVVYSASGTSLSKADISAALKKIK